MTKQEAYRLCVKKAYIHTQKMNGEPCELMGSLTPEYYDGCRSVSIFHRYNWMTSFVTGVAPILYHSEHDETLLKWANSFSVYYHDKVFRHPLDTMHDLGFLYLPYSVQLYLQTGSLAHRETALKAADELAKRFNLNGRFLEAWSGMDSPEKDRRVIADSMMNVPLLLWAWRETSHTFYYDIACAHAETCIRTLVREDDTVCHSYVFHEDGRPAAEANDCGYANGSYWARGAAWMIYGFASMARYTQEDRYLSTSRRLADRYLDSLKTQDLVPPWDFRLPEDLPARTMRREDETPPWDESLAENTILNRDASAAAIAACGLRLLGKLTGEARYRSAADQMLDSLCASYIDTDPSVPGMLSHCNGKLQYAAYADYYLLLALAETLHDFPSCW